MCDNYTYADQIFLSRCKKVLEKSITACSLMANFRSGMNGFFIIGRISFTNYCQIVDQNLKIHTDYATSKSDVL